MHRKKKCTASEAAYQDIKEQILHLELKPGTALSETDTAAKYNISRTPVRDVFKALEAEGLLEIKPRIGTFVSLIDLDMISDILYMREVMEQAIFKDLAATYDKSQEYRIKLVLQEQKYILESDMSLEDMSRAFILSDNCFHYTLYELAGKKNISTFFNTVNSQYERFRTFINMNGKDDLFHLYEDHVEIARCISEKKFDELKERISHHIYDGFNASVLKLHPEHDFFKNVEK